MKALEKLIADLRTRVRTRVEAPASRILDKASGLETAGRKLEERRAGASDAIARSVASSAMDHAAKEEGERLRAAERAFHEDSCWPTLGELGEARRALDSEKISVAEFAAKVAKPKWTGESLESALESAKSRFWNSVHEAESLRREARDLVGFCKEQLRRAGTVLEEDD